MTHGKLVKDLAVYLPSKLLPALTAFITVPIVTRLLAPAQFGDWALAIGVYEFLLAMTCSGLGASAVRFFPEYKAQGRLRAFFANLGTTLGLSVAVGCVLALLALVAVGNLLPAGLSELLFVSVAVFSVQGIYVVFMQVVRAQERSRLYTAFELLTNYGSLAAGLALLYFLGWGVRGLLWGTFAATAVALLLLVPKTLQGDTPRRRQLDVSSTSGLWRYAWPLAIGNMAMWGLRLSDRYLIGIFRARAEVGLYAAAYNISGKSIDMLVAAFLLSMGPLVINTWEKLGEQAAQESLRSATRVFLILCLPAAAGLSVLAQPFVALLTEASYHEGYRIVAFVAFSRLAYGLAQIAGMGLLIAKRTHRIAICQVIAVLANLGLNLVLIPRFGFVAAGATALAGFVILLVLQVQAGRQYLRWPVPWRTLRNTLVATTIMSLTAAGVYALPAWKAGTLSGAAGGVHIGYLLLSVIVAVLVYAICLLLLGEFDTQELAAIRQVGARMARRLGIAPS